VRPSIAAAAAAAAAARALGDAGGGGLAAQAGRLLHVDKNGAGRFMGARTMAVAMAGTGRLEAGLAGAAGRKGGAETAASKRLRASGGGAAALGSAPGGEGGSYSGDDDQHGGERRLGAHGGSWELWHWQRLDHPPMQMLPPRTGVRIGGGGGAAVGLSHERDGAAADPLLAYVRGLLHQGLQPALIGDGKNE
jgi:hypothetical protein